MGLRKALVLASFGLLAACTNSGGTPSVPIVGPIVVSATHLSFTSDKPATVRLSQPSFSGSYVVTGCAGIVTVRFLNNTHGRAAMSISPVGAGSCTLTIEGGNGQSSSISIDVSPSPVAIAPATLTFADTGPSLAQNVTISQPGFHGKFAASSDCAGIASIETTANGRGRATFRVTPLAHGSCSVRFDGGIGESASLWIQVSPPGEVVVAPASLAFTQTGSGAAKTVAVSQQGYAGKFKESGDCAGIASVAASTNGAGKAAYVVTPQARGTCIATFAGGAGATAALPIDVAAAGGITLDPWAMSFTQTHPNTPQHVDVSQAHYSGAFSENDDCQSIATLTAVHNGGGRATFDVLAVGKGTCAATFRGGNGESARLDVDVSLPGPVLATPSSLSFRDTATQSTGVSQTSYAGTFAESDDCATVASIAARSNAGGKATYVVTPLASGSCSATFTGGNQETATLAVTVALPPAAIAVTPDSLSFTETGSGAAQRVAVSKQDYDGSFTVTDSCAGIATFKAIANAGGQATYLVTPEGMGECAAAFSAQGVTSQPLPVSVALPGNVIVDPSSLTFNTLEPSAARDVTVTQQRYTGTFDETDTCGEIARVTAIANAGGTASYRVTPLATGSCTATFTGGNAQTAALSIAVSPYGSVAVSPTSMTFTATGSGAAQTATVSQANYEGSFTEHDTCGGIATVVATSNGYGQASYQVTPAAKGTCKATFTGGGAKSAALSIAVTPYGAVNVQPASMIFNTTGSTQHATVSQSGYTGSFTESDDCSGTATIVATYDGSGRASYAVTASAAGSCTANFTGGNQTSAPLSIVVDLPGGVVVSPAPVAFYALGSTKGTTVTVTQAGFSGTFGESDTCSGVAKVVELSNGGGTAQYRITPVAAGACEVRFAGGNAQKYDLHVSVTLTNVGVDARRQP